MDSFFRRLNYSWGVRLGISWYCWYRPRLKSAITKCFWEIEVNERQCWDPFVRINVRCVMSPETDARYICHIFLNWYLLLWYILSCTKTLAVIMFYSFWIWIWLVMYVDTACRMKCMTHMCILHILHCHMYIMTDVSFILVGMHCLRYLVSWQQSVDSDIDFIIATKSKIK